MAFAVRQTQLSGGMRASVRRDIVACEGDSLSSSRPDCHVTLPKNIIQKSREAFFVRQKRREKSDENLWASLAEHGADQSAVKAKFVMAEMQRYGLEVTEQQVRETLLELKEGKGLGRTQKGRTVSAKGGMSGLRGWSENQRTGSSSKGEAKLREEEWKGFF